MRRLVYTTRHIRAHIVGPPFAAVTQRQSTTRARKCTRSHVLQHQGDKNYLGGVELQHGVLPGREAASAFVLQDKHRAGV